MSIGVMAVPMGGGNFIAGSINWHTIVVVAGRYCRRDYYLALEKGK